MVIGFGAHPLLPYSELIGGGSSKAEIASAASRDRVYENGNLGSVIGEGDARGRVWQMMEVRNACMHARVRRVTLDMDPRKCMHAGVPLDSQLPSRPASTKMHAKD